MFLAPESLLASLLLHTPRAPLLCESHPADERHQGAQDHRRTCEHDRVEKVAIPIREQASADWIATDRGTGDEDKGNALSESAGGDGFSKRVPSKTEGIKTHPISARLLSETLTITGETRETKPPVKKPHRSAQRMSMDSLVMTRCARRPARICQLSATCRQLQVFVTHH